MPRRAKECVLCLAERYHDKVEALHNPSSKAYYRRLNTMQLTKISNAKNLRVLNPCSIEHRIVATALRRQAKFKLKQQLATRKIAVEVAKDRYLEASLIYHHMLASSNATTIQRDKMRLEVNRLSSLVAQRERKVREVRAKLG